MSSNAYSKTLARRLGLSVHVSPLRIRLAKLMLQYPSAGARCLEDWFVDVANARGANFVVRNPPALPDFIPPPLAGFSNEELVVVLCQPNNLDRPPILRVAAQLVSMEAVDANRLLLIARRERAEPVLAELARQAMRVAPDHRVWKALAKALDNVPSPREPLVHWTRLSVPIPNKQGYNAVGWKLIA